MRLDSILEGSLLARLPRLEGRMVSLSRWCAGLAAALSISIGCLVLIGRSGEAFGVLLLVTASIAIASGIVLLNARAIGQIDEVRSQAEEALRSRERIYRAIGESIPFGVWICDAEGRNTYASESFLNLVGLTQEQCSEFGWGDALHPNDTSRTIASWKECVRTEGDWEIEHRFRGTDGQDHPILARGVPVRDKEGRIVSWAGINLDISRLKTSEDALQSSEERQRLALTAARLGNWEWDLKNDRVVSLNGLSILFGRREDQEFRNHEEFLSVVHLDDRTIVLQGIERSLTVGEPHEIEYRVLWPDGSIHWLATRGAIFFDPDGTPSRMVGVSLDITERKNAEAEIRQLNESLERRVQERTAELAEANQALLDGKQRLRAIFDATFQFVGLLSLDGILLEANKTALDFCGLNRDDVVGRPFWEARWWTLSVATQDRLKQAIRDAASGEFVRYEVDVRGIGDVVATIDFSLKPIKDDDGRVTLLIPEGRDITDQKKAAEALRQSEAALRESHRIAGVGTWEWDIDSDTVTWSDELYRIAGRDPSLPAPNYAQNTELHTAESLARLDAVIHRTVQTGEPYEIELEMIGGDGVNRWIIGRGETVRTPDGQIIGLRGTVHDITARKRFEEELRRARDQAMAATQAKSEFLANMSHEIRTPMNGVIGMTELLLATPLEPLQRDYAETIRSSGEALLTVINDILDFSKIEAGKLTIEIVEFHLAGLIEEVARLLAPRARQKGLEIDCRIDPALPSILRGDPIRIRQVLTNLAGNAVKFTDHGQVTIEVGPTDSTDENLKVKILVRDTGIGIPENRQGDIFESFTQVEGGNNRRHGGTGLGLTICRSLVALMGRSGWKAWWAKAAPSGSNSSLAGRQSSIHPGRRGRSGSRQAATQPDALNR
jgi:PAS domain S-box-containing protein